MRKLVLNRQQSIARQLLVTLMTLAALSLLLNSTSAHAVGQSMIIVDASGSMWGKIDGKTKIAIARETLTKVLAAVPPERKLGLIAYGHRNKGQCSDIQQLVSPAAGPRNRAAISKAVNQLKPKGKTPLSASVRLAARQLRYKEADATVILITDGRETCAPDPCSVASELEAAGLNFVVHVVGFGLSEEQGRKVACLAENTGGQFILANKASELSDALTNTVVQAAPPAQAPKFAAKNVSITIVLAQDAQDYPIQGKLEFFDLIGNDPGASATLVRWGTDIKVALEPGQYLLRYSKDLVVHESTLEVSSQGPVKQVVVLNASILKLGVAGAKRGKASIKARVDIVHPDRRKSGAWGPDDFLVPADTELRIQGSLGKASVSESVTTKPGEIVDRVLIASVGTLTVTAVYTPGGESIKKGIRYDVLPPKTSLEGDKEIVGSWGKGNFLLPPGQYRVRSKLGMAEVMTPVTIRGNDKTNLIVDLNAGVLSISAPGARRLFVKSAKPDTSGKLLDMGSKWGPKFDTVLPPGNYIVSVTFADDSKNIEKPVAVQAGKRSTVFHGP